MRWKLQPRTHTQAAQALVVAFHRKEAAVEFGSPLSDRAALFRITLLSPVAWGGGWKRCPKNWLLHPTLGQHTAAGRDPILAVEVQEKTGERP